MKPADLILRVRQRPEWEAIDLGFVLVRKAWRNLLTVWTILLFSILALCMLLTPRDYLWVAVIILWWLKPLYDRVLLHILSRQIFGQQPTTAEVFSTLPSLIGRTGLLGALSWRRFSFSRSYNLPIWQLEQLRGDPRKQRHSLLYLQGHSAAVGLTFVCWFFKVIIVASIVALIILFIPGEQPLEHLQRLMSSASGSDMEYLLELVDLTIIVFAIFITEPFFVAAGFTLYLNRRTQLEAWDIDLAFRSMGERLQQLAAKTSGLALSLFVCGILTISLTYLTPPVQAAEAESEFLNSERLPVSASKAQLEQVMQTEELGELRQVERWVFKEKEDDDDETDTNKSISKTMQALIQLLSSIMKYTIWAIVLIALLLAIIYRRKILGLLKPPTKKAQQHKQPDILFGLDIRPESLPDDIAGEARKLWQDGAARAALSLLYRGTLMQLTRHYDIAINDSHTEGNILHLSQAVLDETRLSYLSRITRYWQMVAYAHRTPTDTEVEPLFNEWPIWTATQFAETPVQERST